MRVFNGRGGQEIVDNFIIGCKGIVPCLDGADRFIKIYKLIQKNNFHVHLKILLVHFHQY